MPCQEILLAPCVKREGIVVIMVGAPALHARLANTVTFLAWTAGPAQCVQDRLH